MRYKDNEIVKRLLLAAFGDSISAGVHLQPEDTYLYKLGALFGCRTWNAGIPGQTTSDALGRLNDFVLEHKPDICVLQFGMNDHVAIKEGESKVTLNDFRSNLIRMIKELRNEGTTPLLCTVHPIIEGSLQAYYYARHPQEWYSPDGANSWLRNYNKVIREVSVETDCLVADVACYWTEHCEELTSKGLLLRTVENSGNDDGVHPTSLGHDCYAACIAVQLDRILKSL
ncbi:MAG: hypothetical protein K0Q73_2975 [Paenibacillus sp.]|nr:hypothetical protein [Paenibacillus sp.]